MKRPTMKLEADEKELLESVERGEWKSVGGGKRERAGPYDEETYIDALRRRG